MDRNDLITLFIAAYKDKVEHKLMEDLRDGLNALLFADAESRREVAATDIKQMANLKIALRRFEIDYDRIKGKCGNVQALDDYIAEIQSQIKALSLKKNHRLS